MLSDESYKCQVLQYHVLKRKDKAPLSLINQKSYETNLENSGKPLSVVSYFVKYRDGSKVQSYLVMYLYLNIIQSYFSMLLKLNLNLENLSKGIYFSWTKLTFHQVKQ